MSLAQNISHLKPWVNSAARLIKLPEYINQSFSKESNKKIAKNAKTVAFIRAKVNKMREFYGLSITRMHCNLAL